MSTEKPKQKRLTPEQWAKVRAVWEADPREGYQWVVGEMELTVTDDSVRKKSLLEGWAKHKTLEQLRVSAHRVADKKSAKDKKVGEIVGSPTFESEAAIDIRATIIEQHRKDCDGIRSVLDEKAVVTDLDKGKAMKTGIEAVAALHALERKAYALDEQPPEQFNGGASMAEVDAVMREITELAEKGRRDKAKENAAHEAHG